MCGIAGLVDLSGTRPLPSGALQPMAGALVHRGPDHEGYLLCAGVGFANRRLSIVGLSHGRRPIANEDGTAIAVFNGELFDYPEVKHVLEGRGHRFSSHCDTELIPLAVPTLAIALNGDRNRVRVVLDHRAEQRVQRRHPGKVPGRQIAAGELATGHQRL